MRILILVGVLVASSSACQGSSGDGPPPTPTGTPVAVESSATPDATATSSASREEQPLPFSTSNAPAVGTPADVPGDTGPTSDGLISGVNEELFSKLFSPSDLGAGWDSAPTRGEDSALIDPCSIARLEAKTIRVAGVHYAGIRSPDAFARPQWYQTIAELPDDALARDYTSEITRSCTYRDIYQWTDEVVLGDQSLHLSWGTDGLDGELPYQRHHIFLIRRGRFIMQIQYEQFGRGVIEPAQLARLLVAADDRFRELTEEP